MVIKIKTNMILLIFFNLFFAGCFTMNDSQLNNEILLFENYTQTKIKLPKEHFLSETIIFFNDSIFLDKELLLHSEYGSNIDGELFDSLSGLDLINQWSIYKQSDVNPYSYDYNNFVEKRRQELKLTYLGKLNLSQAFNSFLILVSEGEDDYNIIKRVFLLNVVNNDIVSITRMCNYTCFDGECNYIFTKKLKKNVFIQKDIEISSNMILPEEIQPNNEETVIMFTYNKKGYVKVLVPKKISRTTTTKMPL